MHHSNTLQTFPRHHFHLKIHIPCITHCPTHVPPGLHTHQVCPSALISPPRHTIPGDVPPAPKSTQEKQLLHQNPPDTTPSITRVLGLKSLHYMHCLHVVPAPHIHRPHRCTHLLKKKSPMRGTPFNTHCFPKCTHLVTSHRYIHLYHSLPIENYSASHPAPQTCLSVHKPFQ